jgi:hypothetical protein
MTNVKSVDARLILEALIKDNAREAAGSNTLVSRPEEAKLVPYSAERAALMRAEGGRGARVKEQPLVERTLQDAQEIWSKYNPASNPASALYLSKAEIAAITEESSALGALTQLAYDRVRGGSSSSGIDAARVAVQTFFKTYNFAADDVTGQLPLAAGLPGATVLDGRSAAVRGTLPGSVRESFDVYDKLSDADIGNVYLQRAQISGHQVYIVYGVTDGDPAFLEVFGATGQPVTSARLNGTSTPLFDDSFFGRPRFHPTIVREQGLLTEEGLSEPAEQIAAGQPLSNWPGVTRLSTGELHYDAGNTYRLTDVEIPMTKDDPRYDVAVAAFEYLWEMGLKYRIVGSTDPFRLGALREGELVLGPFTRNDGKTYEVAKWRDIDDGSFTLYFERTSGEQLRLHTSQFDN